MVSLNEAMLKLSRHIFTRIRVSRNLVVSQKREPHQVSWHCDLIRNTLRILSSKVSTKHFYKKTLRSVMWKASGKEKLIRFLEKVLSWKAFFGNFKRELCSSLRWLMKQVGTFLYLHLFNTSVNLFSGMLISMYLRI